MSSTLKVDILQDSGGNNIIASDGSGNLTTQKINYPAFAAYLSADTNITDDTWTKVQINTETLDTDNCYDNSTNYRFTPTTAGKYLVYYGVTGINSAATSNNVNAAIYKNGSAVNGGSLVFNSDQFGGSVSVNEIIDFNGSTDYVEFYIKIDSTSGTPRVDANFNGPRSTHAGAYRIGD